MKNLTNPNPGKLARSFLLARSTVFAVAVTLLVVSMAGAAPPPKGPNCRGGYYAVDGAPLLPDMAAGDAIMIGRGEIATRSGCAPVPATVFRAGRQRRGAASDRLVGRWARCGGASKVVLRATLSADCQVLSGTVKARGTKRRPFVAREAWPEQLREEWGGSSDQPPAGFSVVTQAEFLAASERSGFGVVSQRSLADNARAAELADAANVATLDAFAREHPERAAFTSIGIDPRDPDIAPSGDGNYRLTRHAEDGSKTEIATLGPRTQRGEIANTIRSFPTRDNQLAIYAQQYDIAAAFLDPQLPTPASLATWTAEDIAALNVTVGEQLQGTGGNIVPLPGEELPASYPGACSAEIGAGLDPNDGSAVCERSPRGLWRNATWPLKYYDTCTRNQGSRGTCAAFAITAGREIQLARRYGRWINLSEQQLYFQAKTMLQPSTYGDGLLGLTLLQQLLETNYQQPFEETWDYNPSWRRVDDAAAQSYTDSCVGYQGDEAQFCSDTSGQGFGMCTTVPRGFTCARTSAPVTGTTVRSTAQPAEFWNPSIPGQGLVNVLTAVNFNATPTLLSIPVVSSFESVSQSGFVTFDPERAEVCATKSGTEECDPDDDCECSRGGHAVLAVGAVRNEQLPASVSPGAGGGYIVVKNSWGCVGDGGYYYLPFDWVKAFVRGARPVGPVDPSGPLPDQFERSPLFEYQPAPPTIRIVQPLASESYVEGQSVPLVVSGADYQETGYELRGTTRWASSAQGDLGQGLSRLVALAQGAHTITATYTSRSGVVATAGMTILVGPRPLDLPPTPHFARIQIRSGGECAVACNTFCVVGFGFGDDAEDGILGYEKVRWYAQAPFGSRTFGSKGRSLGPAGQFLTCAPMCGGTYVFTLEVEDSQGQRTEVRREYPTRSCVN